ncbi:histone acetyltransferase [Paenibacillus popilliae ATCC 14706]|uniref:Histone acetyltransferase n=1 Tax=Paenibacillus popilliae ATCC 14706 TaxID=1212764 RepID=M9L9L0_PAEPP|nr:histone acetyltransferase [Paenibacillus popilliae ATCC 14706]
MHLMQIQCSLELFQEEVKGLVEKFRSAVACHDDAGNGSWSQFNRKDTYSQDKVRRLGVFYYKVHILSQS